MCLEQSHKDTAGEIVLNTRISVGTIGHIFITSVASLMLLSAANFCIFCFFVVRIDYELFCFFSMSCTFLCWSCIMDCCIVQVSLQLFHTLMENSISSSIVTCIYRTLVVVVTVMVVSKQENTGEAPDQIV